MALVNLQCPHCGNTFWAEEERMEKSFNEHVASCRKSGSK